MVAPPTELRLLQADLRDYGLHIAVSSPPDADLSELLCRPVRAGPA